MALFSLAVEPPSPQARRPAAVAWRSDAMGGLAAASYLLKAAALLSHSGPSCYRKLLMFYAGSPAYIPRVQGAEDWGAAVPGFVVRVSSEPSKRRDAPGAGAPAAVLPYSSGLGAGAAAPAERSRQAKPARRSSSMGSPSL